MWDTEDSLIGTNPGSRIKMVYFFQLFPIVQNAFISQTRHFQGWAIDLIHPMLRLNPPSSGTGMQHMEASRKKNDTKTWFCKISSAQKMNLNLTSGLAKKFSQARGGENK